jgi:hypothetical protein
MAYEIIKKLLDLHKSGVKKREADKAQIHKLFENSFDAKEYNSENLLIKSYSICISIH